MISHTQEKFLEFKPVDLFDIVADIEKYPEFIPWCQAARVTVRSRNELEAELVVRFKAFTERYTSRVILNPKTEANRVAEIKVEAVDGPFSVLKNHWQFEERDGGTLIKFQIDFCFKSMILQGLIGMMFDKATSKMIDAFEKRAKELLV